MVTLHNGGLRTLASGWHLPELDVLTIESSLRTVIGHPVIFGSAPLPAAATSFPGDLSTFALAPLLFGEALAAGWPWALSMLLFSGLLEGQSCDGLPGLHPGAQQAARTFPSGGWQCCMITSEADPDVTVTLYFDDVGVGYVSCTRVVLGAAADGRGPVTEQDDS